eukprot:jgi/Psemu1/308320/fgenesh1_kg.399_\
MELNSNSSASDYFTIQRKIVLRMNLDTNSTVRLRVVLVLPSRILTYRVRYGYMKSIESNQSNRINQSKLEIRSSTGTRTVRTVFKRSNRRIYSIQFNSIQFVFHDCNIPGKIAV